MDRRPPVSITVRHVQTLRTDFRAETLSHAADLTSLFFVSCALVRLSLSVTVRRDERLKEDEEDAMLCSKLVQGETREVKTFRSGTAGRCLTSRSSL